MATFGMMLMTVALAAQPVEATATKRDAAVSTPAASSATAATPRTPAQLREAVHATLKAAATSEGAARVDAAKQLAALYDELMHDTQMVKEDRVSLAGTIRSRLQKMDAEAKAALARAKRNDPAHVGGADQPVGENGVLAQQLPKGAAGKNLIGGGAAKGGATQADYSQQLIDVIQTTIAPGSWDVNGGNGSIKFFPGLNVMIIRNTAENQEDLVDVLNALRKQ